MQRLGWRGGRFPVVGKQFPSARVIRGLMASNVPLAPAPGVIVETSSDPLIKSLLPLIPAPNEGSAATPIRCQRP